VRVAAVKVCGATGADEVDAAARAGADLLGLWYGVSGGRHDLSAGRLAALGARTRATGVLQRVLVRFLDDPRAIAEAADRAEAGWVQLHGYQSPKVVAELRRLLDPRVSILKVLHLMDDRCPERPFVRRYERAGADAFLVDSATADGKIGSTGIASEAVAIRALLDECACPVMIAGGLSAENAADYAALRVHPQYMGADFDTHARGADGLLGAHKIAPIVLRWA
jgi:phosphoribosylanthranilate isomerase